MTDALWNKTLQLLDEDQAWLNESAGAEPLPSAKLCRESIHRTLGHLAACQSAWLPIMRAARDREARAVVPINPDPLYRKLKWDRAPWAELLERFNSDRLQWKAILEAADLDLETRTARRIYSARSLTRRLAEHERRHLLPFI